MQRLILIGCFISTSLSLAALQVGESRYVYCRKGDSACSIGRYNLGVGVGWSRYAETSVFLPQLELQIALMDRFAIGFSGGGINTNSVYRKAYEVPSVVLGASLHFYSREAYKGFWFQLGGAEYLYKKPEGNGRYASYAAALSTVGWRWRPDDLSGSLGLAVGVQRLFRSGAYLQPLLRLDAAIDFNLDSIFY